VQNAPDRKQYVVECFRLSANNPNLVDLSAWS